MKTKRRAVFYARAMGIAAALVPLGAQLTSCGDADVLLAALGGDCLLDSDCDGELVCRFRRCHAACELSEDCPAGERCVSSETGSGVCLLAVEESCSRNSDCPAPLQCGPDGQCRNECAADPDCRGGEVCPAEHVCAGVGELDPSGHLPGAGTATPLPCAAAADCVAPERCVAGLCRVLCASDGDCPLSRCVEGTCAPPAVVSGPQCVPGEQRACVCANGMDAGVQVCATVAGMEATFDFGACAGCPGVITTTDCWPDGMSTTDPRLTSALTVATDLQAPSIQSYALGPAGEVHFAGLLSVPSALFGGQSLSLIGQQDAVIGQLDNQGNLVWFHQYADTAGLGDVGALVEVDPDSGDLWVVGSFSGVGSLSLGGVPTYSGQGGFVIHLASDGTYLGEQSFTTTAATAPRLFRVTVRDGEVAVVGQYFGDLDFSAPTLSDFVASNPDTVASMFLALFDATNGSAILSKEWDSAGVELLPTAVELLAPKNGEPRGEIVVAGTFTGSYDFGDGAVSGTDRPFLEKLPYFAMEIPGATTLDVRVDRMARVAGDVVDLGGQCTSCTLFGATADGEFTARADFAVPTATFTPELSFTSPLVAVLSQGRSVTFDILQAGNTLQLGDCTVPVATTAQPVLIVRDAAGAPTLVRHYPSQSNVPLALPIALETDGASNVAMAFLPGSPGGDSYDFGDGITHTGTQFLLLLNAP